jgi:hypothetical protein
MWRRAALLALLTSLLAGRAHAFVRYTTDRGVPWFWKDSCVPVTIYLNDFDTKAGWPPNQVAKSVAAAAHAWSPDAVACIVGGVTIHPYLEIVPTLSAEKTPPSAGYDARNSIIFQTESWTMSGKPNGKPYAFEALAVTTVTAKSDGHIVDADIEINAVNQAFIWMNLDPGVVPPFDHSTTRINDLQNALTHEFGHLLGLDHTCFKPSFDNPNVNDAGKLRPLDDQGQPVPEPVPDCDSAPASVQQTVMFDKILMDRETSKRTLSPDDMRAMCVIYKPEADPNVCAIDQASAGCEVASAVPPHRPRGTRGGLPFFAVVGIGSLGVGVWRRRARAVSGRVNERGRARS